MKACANMTGELCRNCGYLHYDSPKGKNTGISVQWIHNRCEKFEPVENHSQAKQLTNRRKEGSEGVAPASSDVNNLRGHGFDSHKGESSLAQRKSAVARGGGGTPPVPVKSSGVLSNEEIFKKLGNKRRFNPLYDTDDIKEALQLKEKAVIEKVIRVIWDDSFISTEDKNRLEKKIRGWK